MEKRHILLFLSLLTFTTVTFKVISFPVEEKISVQVIKNRIKIKKITDKRFPKVIKKFFIDKINFPEAGHLTHYRVGAVDFDRDFFIDFKTIVKVKRSGRYRFLIYSDDGFLLKIDGKEVARFIKDRPFNKTEGSVYLNKGEHVLSLSYFQGFGRAGLQAYYGLDQELAPIFFIGEDSQLLEFRSPFLRKLE